MDKIKLLNDAPRWAMPYAHLDPVVDFLLDHGNRLAHDFRWGSNREGFFCHMAFPIDFEQLQSAFDFPSTILLGRDRNVIYCQTSGCIIKKIG